ncbi:MARCKS-related protein [Rhinophrynus dorsalis]
MGSHESKSKSVDITTSKAVDQQENGHVKTNGDAAAKQNGDSLPTQNGDPAVKQNGDAAPSNGSAEPVPEKDTSGEVIESAPANGDAKPEEPPGKNGKKKRFSFKKLKLGGNPFRKNKKEQAAVEETPAEEAGSPKADDANPPAEVKSDAEEPETASAHEEPVPEVATTVQSESADVPPPEETPKPTESDPSTEPPAEPQKQEE